MLSDTMPTASVESLPPTLAHRMPDLPPAQVVSEQPDSTVTNRLREAERERDLLRAHIAIIEEQKHSLETRLAAIEHAPLVRVARTVRRWFGVLRIRV